MVQNAKKRLSEVLWSRLLYGVSCPIQVGSIWMRNAWLMSDNICVVSIWYLKKNRWRDILLIFSRYCYSTSRYLQVRKAWTMSISSIISCITAYCTPADWAFWKASTICSSHSCCNRMHDSLQVQAQVASCTNPKRSRATNIRTLVCSCAPDPE